MLGNRLSLAALMAAAALGLAACENPIQSQRDFLLQEGAWGWDKGKGCEGMRDALVIEGKWIHHYRDGERVDRAMILARNILHENTSGVGTGKIDGMMWIYIARDPDNPQELVRHHQQFNTGGGFGRTTHITSWLKRTIVYGEDKKKKRIKDPRGGQKLAPCPEELQPREDTDVPQGADPAPPVID